MNKMYDGIRATQHETTSEILLFSPLK